MFAARSILQTILLWYKSVPKILSWSFVKTHKERENTFRTIQTILFMKAFRKKYII